LERTALIHRLIPVPQCTQADGLGAVAAGLRDPSPRVSRKAAQLLGAVLTERPALAPPVADAAAAGLPPLLRGGDRDAREAALALAAALAEHPRASPTLFQVCLGATNPEALQTGMHYMYACPTLQRGQRMPACHDPAAPRRQDTMLSVPPQVLEGAGASLCRGCAVLLTHCNAVPGTCS
jgi:hypothetical protein